METRKHMRGLLYIETWRGIGSWGHLFAIRTVSGECLASGEVGKERQLTDAINRAFDAL